MASDSLNYAAGIVCDRKILDQTRCSDWDVIEIRDYRENPANGVLILSLSKSFGGRKCPVT